MDRHDQFAGKNAASARAWEMDQREKQKQREMEARKKRGPRIAICSECGKEKEVKVFRTNDTKSQEGSSSFGIVEKLLCENCRPQPKQVQEMSKKQIKSMLRGAKRGLR